MMVDRNSADWGVGPDDTLDMSPPPSGWASNMTMRDYFIAHAPADIPNWFNPVMRPCPAVPSHTQIADDATRQDVVIAMDCGTDPETPAGQAWIEQRNEAATAQEAWQHEFRRERYLQWPAAWADLMLIERHINRGTTR
jgi:hypothetical protein